MALDLVKRDFRAPVPSQLWVADITYVPTAAGCLNLAEVLDVSSRRIMVRFMRDTLHVFRSGALSQSSVLQSGCIPRVQPLCMLSSLERLGDGEIAARQV